MIMATYVWSFYQHACASLPKYHVSFYLYWEMGKSWKVSRDRERESVGNHTTDV